MSRRNLFGSLLIAGAMVILVGIFAFRQPTTNVDKSSGISADAPARAGGRQALVQKSALQQKFQATLKHFAADGQATELAGEWRTDAEYVGSQACRQCHAEQYETYQQSAHSRALADVEYDFEPPDAVFDHVASGRRYRVARREGQLLHEESLPLDDGTEFMLTSTPVRHRVGSGHFARSYLCDAGSGFLFESPITWYESAEKWGMTPGFDKAAHRSFSRQILENCLWCHAGRVQTSTESTMRFRVIENAIGCERCHGPGKRHVDSQLAGNAVIDAVGHSIINPRRLPRKLADAVCQQCHLQGDIQIGGRRVRAPDYRPGEPLENFATVYRLRRPERGMTVVGHVEQLGESLCYLRSETLTCATCHNPHRPVAPAYRVEHYRSVCLSCHQNRDCKLPLAPRQEKSKNDCTECHMPKSTTEVPHLAFTHHHIGMHPLTDGVADAATNSLIPLSDLSTLTEVDSTRSLMLARIEMFLLRGLDFQKSQDGQQLLRQVDEWWQSLRTEAVDVEIEFARMQLSLARGDLRGAIRSAGRALAFEDIRTEEEAAILGQLGQIEFRQGRFEQARLRFEKLTRLRCNGQDWFYLGRCQIQCGQTETAIASFERARQLEPAAIGIYEALAELYHSRGELTEERRERDAIEQLGRRRRSGSTTRSR